MTYDFIDRFTHLNSQLHQLDPRAKIVGIICAVAVITSTPRDHIKSFLYFYLIIAGLVLVSHIPPYFFASRCLLASPFIVMAAFLPFLSLWLEGGQATSVSSPTQLSLSVLLKSYAAILLLTLLISTSRFNHLLWGLRQLHAPHILHAIITLMYSYIFILLDEWRRAAQARSIRTPQGLKVSRVGLFGKHVALVFIRGWERAERVQAAMTVRGFNGMLPVRDITHFGARDTIFLVLLVSAFISARQFAM